MPVRCSDSHRTAVLCRGLPGLGYASAGRMFDVLRHPAVQLCRCRELPSQDCRCCASVRDTLLQLFRALPRSAGCYQCDAGAQCLFANPSNACALFRFSVRCHAVPVQGLSLFPNAKPLRSSATQCHREAVPHYADARWCEAVPHLADAPRSIPMPGRCCAVPEPCAV